MKQILYLPFLPSKNNFKFISGVLLEALPSHYYYVIILLSSAIGEDWNLVQKGEIVSSKILDKEKLSYFVENLAKGHKVFAPVQRRSDVSFQEVSTAEMIKLDYKTTTLPPKKFFHYCEDLMTFKGDRFKVPQLDPKDTVLIFGVHSCDLNAILRQDRFFSREYDDPYYRRRRENSVIVALTCMEAGDNCFCYSLGTGPTIKEGFDLLLTDIGEHYLIEVGSKKGEVIIKGHKLKDASTASHVKKDVKVKESIMTFKKSMKIEGLGELASSADNHDVWTLIGEKGGLSGCFACLSCGNCSLVCPSCYCYEVSDLVDLSLNGSVRRRELDSCQLLEYAQVALNGNFRADRKSRIRHWMRCKFGSAGGGIDSSCVGCGRCIHSCPADIDLTEVAKNLWGE